MSSHVGPTLGVGLATPDCISLLIQALQGVKLWQSHGTCTVAHPGPLKPLMEVSLLTTRMYEHIGLRS